MQAYKARLYRFGRVNQTDFHGAEDPYHLAKPEFPGDAEDATAELPSGSLNQEEYERVVYSTLREPGSPAK